MSTEQLDISTIEDHLGDILCREPGAIYAFDSTPNIFANQDVRRLFEVALDLASKNPPVPVTPENLAAAGAGDERELRARARRATVDIRQGYTNLLRLAKLNAYRREYMEALRRQFKELAGASDLLNMESMIAEKREELNAIEVPGREQASHHIGDIMQTMERRPESEREAMLNPISFRFAWLNRLMKGGLRVRRKLVIAGPHKQRKTTTWYNLNLDAAMNGHRVLAMHFDGGDKEAHVLNYWMVLAGMYVHEADAPRYAEVDTGHGIALVPIIEQEVMTALLYRQPLQIDIPDETMACIEAAREHLREMTNGSESKRVLQIVDMGDVQGELRQSLYLLRRKFASEGFDLWGVDHMAKPQNGRPDNERAGYNASAYVDFCDTSGVPCILLAQQTKSGIETAKSGVETHSANLRYLVTLEHDADFVLTTGYDGDGTPNALTWTMWLSRVGLSGPNVKAIYQIDPNSGYINERGMVAS